MLQRKVNEINLKSILESLLFSIGEPILIGKITKILEKDENLITETIESLKNDYKKEDRGLRIINKEHKIQLVSAPKNSQYIQRLIKSDLRDELSQASLETLAIIAYRGPIARAEIEEIRGVNSSFILRQLLLQGLIERKNNPQDTRAYIYEVSFDFLKRFGLNSTKELPEYNEFSLKKINN